MWIFASGMGFYSALVFEDFYPKSIQSGRASMDLNMGVYCFCS